MNSFSSTTCSLSLSLCHSLHKVHLLDCKARASSSSLHLFVCISFSFLPLSLPLPPSLPHSLLSLIALSWVYMKYSDQAPTVNT